MIISWASKEKTMSNNVSRHLRNAVTELKIDGGRLDVVSYDEADKVFRVVECKRTKRRAGVGQTFGQAQYYLAKIREHPFEFVDAFSRILHPPMRFGRYMEATDWGRRIAVEVYVALTDAACKDVARLRALRQANPDVGVIRIKPTGHLRHFVYVDGKKNYNLAKARRLDFEIVRRDW